MIALRPGSARGFTRVDHTVSRHAFSFGDYFDPAHMGFGPVRVVNEVELAPGAAMALERRANVEILVWVLAGQVRRTCGEATIALEAGDLHVLGAGRGIDDGLANASAHAPARLLQVWIQPARVNAEPRSGHRLATAPASRESTLLASADGRAGSLPLRGDVEVWLVRLAAGGHAVHACCLGQRVWMQVAVGTVEVNGVQAVAGDAAIALNEGRIELSARAPADVLLFALPAG